MAFLPSFPKGVSKKQKEYRATYTEKDASDIMLFPCGCRLGNCFDFLLNFYSFFIRDSCASHQKSVGVYSKGSTGNEGAVILPGGDTQQTGVMGQHCIDFLYLISKDFTQHIQIEHICQFQLFQIGKHFLGSKAAVTR